MFAAFGAFYLVQISPHEFWLYGFVGYCIPVLLLLHVALLLYWVFKGSWKAALPILALLAGWQHVRSTFHANISHKEEKQGLKIINYNVRVFNVYDHLRALNPTAPSGMINWLISQQADVLCLQEFYNDKNSAKFNTREKIDKGGFNSNFILADKQNWIGAEFGLAIFTKFPLVGKGAVPFNTAENNKAIYVDLICQKDTIRIYNVHFHSMKLSLDELVREEREIKRMHQLKDTFYRMREGFVAHSKEAEILKEHVKASPYPVILAGDFNDLPYSYTYLTFREFLNNSFEQAGNGFGFTYRGWPSLIRIDNQFSSKEFDIALHEVHNEIDYSDHYPVSVVYNSIDQD